MENEFSEYLKKMAILLDGVTKIDYNGSNFQKLDAIGQYYRALENEIINHHKTRPNQSYRAYAFNWDLVFNVVEKMAWDCIRTKGNVPLYPQFPVLNCYLDFGNPIHKIGFEVDGKKWHNIENDISRDKKLKIEGWTIYRVSGKEMMRTNYVEYYQFEFDFDDNEICELTPKQKSDLEYWLLNTGDGVLEAIKIKYFTGFEYVNEKHLDYFNGLINQTLIQHTIV